MAFFEALVDVGPAKYAKALPLFKSKKKEGSLKPLNSLISNTCVGLLTWLNDFVIDAEEENALSATFQAQLLKEKDLLEKLFCHLESYNELITGINGDNLEEFYAYILKLHKNKPEETKIDYSAIPWVYIESTNQFALASSVYWPDSFSKLSDTNKYSSVKSVIETISDEKLPHFFALQIKAPFALGGNNFQLAAITPKQNSIDVIPVNDFLDWIETNGEKELLNHLSFSKVDDKFSIGKVSGTLTYYTTDETLIKFIESAVISTKLSLFPKELYTKERNKIGLLEGVPLLKFIIENGQAIPSLAKFIQQTKDADLAKQYIELLNELNIESSKSYTADDAEFRILKLISTHIIDDAAKVDSFREKIFLDGIKLLEKAVSADVRMFDADNKFIYQFQGIEISDILPAYKGKTYPVSEIIELFVDFRDVESLRKIFKAKGRGTKKIYKELLDLKLDSYNAAQTLFLSYYQSLYPDEKVLEGKIFFSAVQDESNEEYVKELHRFLDYCLKEGSYIGFVDQGIIPLFYPVNYISIDEYATDYEKLPNWLNEWVNKSETEHKKLYLNTLKINTESSAIVLYRKAIKEGQLEPMTVNSALVDNDLLLINTLTWLSIQHTKNDFVIKKGVLLPLYQKLHNRKISIDKLLFPYLMKYEVDAYSLDSVKENEELHFMHQDWGEYKQSIFLNLVTKNKITDDVLPKTYRDAWKVIEKPFEKLPNSIDINNNSYQFDEEYYQEWDLKKEYNIQVYKGFQLPYLIKYNNNLIESIKDKYADYIDNAYYVVESKKESILFQLDGVLNDSALNALKLHKQNLIEKEKEAEKKIQFTEEESAVWKELFGNEIPESYYQDINLAACVSALVVLHKKGYDVSKAEVNLSNTHLFAQIYPIYKIGSTEELTIMCRSAIGGILYLTAQAWERLGRSDIHLFVKTGQKENNYHLLYEKEDVLKVSDTKYQVFRVEASSSSLTTDEILSGTFAKDKIWLILKMKENEKYKSIFEGDIKRNDENPDYDNINISENSPY